MFKAYIKIHLLDNTFTNNLLMKKGIIDVVDQWSRWSLDGTTSYAYGRCCMTDGQLDKLSF